MKFFCEQCKAKYQIADDRIVGKTVRMKCRKCGHMIEVRAAVTESSVSVPPQSVAPVEASSKPAAAASKPALKAPLPKPSALATSLTAAKPPSARPERPTSALAGAFKNNVQRDDEGSAPFDMAELAPGDDWYVAVNGVPVGPIRIGEVRRKAALGAVTEDSLVWQEGLDEWRPVKAFPELAATVREASLGGRASMTPPPGEVRTSIPPPSRLPAMRTSLPSISPSRLSMRPGYPAAAPSPLGRSNVVPITSRLATAERLDEAPTEIGAYHTLATDPRLAASVAPDPFAAPAAAMAAAALAAGASASAMAAPGIAHPIVAQASIVPPAKKPVPWIPIGMVFGFIAFGITGAIMAFGGKEAAAPAPVTAPAAVAATAAATVAAAPTTATTAEPAAVPSAEVRVAAAGAPKAAAASGAGAAGGSMAPLAPLSTAHSLNLGGLSHGINPDDPESAGVPGQCISGSQVQQVIANHQVAIRRSCWERNPSMKPSANVSVSLTVMGDGSAQSISATGDDPAVAKCIETDIHNWRFPAMGCSQKTSFGFKFVRQ